MIHKLQQKPFYCTYSNETITKRHVYCNDSCGKSLDNFQILQYLKMIVFCNSFKIVTKDNHLNCHVTFTNDKIKSLQKMFSALVEFMSSCYLTSMCTKDWKTF